jgi:hypothetical protein
VTLFRLPDSRWVAACRDFRAYRLVCCWPCFYSCAAAECCLPRAHPSQSSVPPLSKLPVSRVAGRSLFESASRKLDRQNDDHQQQPVAHRSTPPGRHLGHNVRMHHAIAAYLSVLRQRVFVAKIGYLFLKRPPPRRMLSVGSRARRVMVAKSTSVDSYVSRQGQFNEFHHP